MRKHDYMNASWYAHSEDRTGFGLYLARNFTILGLTRRGLCCDYALSCVVPIEILHRNENGMR
jgi:hypothetical protein